MITEKGGGVKGRARRILRRSVKIHEFPLFRLKILKTKIICCQKQKHKDRSEPEFASNHYASGNPRKGISRV